MAISIGMATLEASKQGKFSVVVGDVSLPVSGSIVADFVRLASLNGHGDMTLESFTSPAKTAKAAKAAKRKSSRGRRVRRSEADFKKGLVKIVAALKSSKSTKKTGMRTEVLTKATGLSRADIQKPLQLGLKSKALRKTGHKRATTYFAK